MWNSGLDEAQAGIKIAGRSINNLRCTEYMTLMTESEELIPTMSMFTLAISCLTTSNLHWFMDNIQDS